MQRLGTDLNDAGRFGRRRREFWNFSGSRRF
jgi:hypothetical protein